MTFGSLFSGIGGMDLGLERAGFRVVWQSEIDPYACRVLARHWPDVPNLGDITRIDWSAVERPDLVCGGFPCQDISFAGKGAGLAGARSGLWYEFARCIREVRPRYVLVENVAALLVRGLDAVLGTLASLGYDAEWECLPAAAFGAPHIRERVFVLAYAQRGGCGPVGECGGVEGVGGGRQDDLCPAPESGRRLANTSRPERGPDDGRSPSRAGAGGQAEGPILRGGRTVSRLSEFEWGGDPGDDPQSGVGRVAHGVPNRVDRLRGLGNAVVPAVAEYIGRRILESVTEANS